ncbi:hypothetical protein [Chryseobacterium gregarium]|uniref:hypothetical protein n=1 Tax=Chryseobacterium gregarium TaxID=456299 RepID=UPI0004159F58|nr:hypothetical protein [Chryseobacterium gregarium]
MAPIARGIPGGFSGKSGTAAGIGRCGQDLIRRIPKCSRRATDHIKAGFSADRKHDQAGMAGS